MALPIDVKDFYRFGKQVTADRDEPIRLAVFVEVDAPESLLDAIREAVRPRTAQAFVDVAVVEGATAIPVGMDAAIVLLGSAGEEVRLVSRTLRAKLVPTVVLALAENRGTLDFDMGVPIDDVLAVPDTAALVDEALAGWLADRLGGKRLALAVNFDFTRRAVGMEIVKATALQNTLIGVVAILPGTDMPIMTANQGKMLLQLATAYGQRIGADRLGELAAVVGGGFALRAVARQALTAVPGFGWAVKGGIAYTGTMAMGRAAIKWFEQGADVGEVAERLKDLARRRGAAEIDAVVVEASPEPTGPVQQTLEIGPASDGT